LYGLLRSAIRGPDLVLVFEHKALFAVRGTIPAEDPLMPLGVADVAREGGDVTIVATQQMRHRALDAATELAREGIEATVIDPRTLVPFDDATVVASLEATSRLAAAQEAPADGSCCDIDVDRVRWLLAIASDPDVIENDDLGVPRSAIEPMFPILDVTLQLRSGPPRRYQHRDGPRHTPSV
jgi:acetoin:2,6-dichlorophenolindophenol oxidoreductase subunit beta